MKRASLLLLLLVACLSSAASGFEYKRVVNPLRPGRAVLPCVRRAEERNATPVVEPATTPATDPSPGIKVDETLTSAMEPAPVLTWPYQVAAVVGVLLGVAVYVKAKDD